MINGSYTDDIASTHLGKRSDGSVTYDPTLLVAVPRIENRKQYNISPEDLPFGGYDVWHCYEFSVLTNNNLPITKVLKLKYSCDSEFIIESKSLKLYLNSFNMSNFGSDTEQCLTECKSIIEKDLSEKLKTTVSVNFLDDNILVSPVFENYTDVMTLADKNIKVHNFKEAPELLEIEWQNEKSFEYRLKFNSLRSNCRVTHQPDFGDVYIYYKSRKAIDCSSLVKYLVSFRSEYHFHEECCEMIYKRLSDILDADDELMVAALYTRRGGIDITPVRYSKGLRSSDVDKILDLSAFARSGIKQ